MCKFLGSDYAAYEPRSRGRWGCTGTARAKSDIYDCLVRHEIMLTVYVRVDPNATTVFVTDFIFYPFQWAECRNRWCQNSHQQQVYKLHCICAIH